MNCNDIERNYDNMIRKVPEFFGKLLIRDYGQELAEKIINGYSSERNVTLRINTLKTNSDKIKEKLDKEKIEYEEVEWNENALIIKNAKEEDIRKIDIYERGEIYLQSLSSMLPSIILGPKANENILDMTAAPGGKTTQMAALSNNEAMITACEKNKIRADRLKFNIERQGARVNIMRQDARMLDDFFSFDKILLDAPCSGSGTENIFTDKFNEELITRSKDTQEKLLNKAVKVLRAGGELIYSTCSILKEENEDILNKVIKKYDLKIVEIEEMKRNTIFASYSEAEQFA